MTLSNFLGTTVLAGGLILGPKIAYAQDDQKVITKEPSQINNIVRILSAENPQLMTGFKVGQNNSYYDFNSNDTTSANEMIRSVSFRDINNNNIVDPADQFIKFSSRNDVTSVKLGENKQVNLQTLSPQASVFLEWQRRNFSDIYGGDQLATNQGTMFVNLNSSSLPLQDQNTQLSNQPETYTVKPGDILGRLANTWGTTVQEIIDANSSTYPTIGTGATANIKVGWELRNPTSFTSQTEQPTLEDLTWSSGVESVPVDSLDSWQISKLKGLGPYRLAFSDSLTPQSIPFENALDNLATQNPNIYDALEDELFSTSFEPTTASKRKEFSKAILDGNLTTKELSELRGNLENPQLFGYNLGNKSGLVILNKPEVTLTGAKYEWLGRGSEKLLPSNLNPLFPDQVTRLQGEGTYVLTDSLFNHWNINPNGLTAVANRMQSINPNTQDTLSTILSERYASSNSAQQRLFETLLKDGLLTKDEMSLLRQGSTQPQIFAGNFSPQNDSLVQVPGIVIIDPLEGTATDPTVTPITSTAQDPVYVTKNNSLPSTKTPIIINAGTGYQNNGSMPELKLMFGYNDLRFGLGANFSTLSEKSPLETSEAILSNRTYQGQSQNFRDRLNVGIYGLIGKVINSNFDIYGGAGFALEKDESRVEATEREFDKSGNLLSEKSVDKPLTNGATRTYPLLKAGLTFRPEDSKIGGYADLTFTLRSGSFKEVFSPSIGLSLYLK